MESLANIELVRQLRGLLISSSTSSKRNVDRKLEVRGAKGASSARFLSHKFLSQLVRPCQHMLADRG